MSTTNKPHKLQKKRLKKEIRRERSAKYSISASPLYALKSIHRLAALLRMTVEEVRNVGENPTYRHFVDESVAGKVRKIQEPTGLTLTLHYRFLRLLDRIQRPEFLHSATKDRSHLSNSSQHIGVRAMAATDIASFYENTTTQHLKNFFLGLGWARDISTLMSTALTVEGHLATGSACSPLMSYFVHLKLFERIENLCDQAQVTMTLYVDDLTISGNHATKTLLHQIKGEFKRAGLRSHKDRFAPPGRPMVVTGATPSQDRLLLRNKHRKSICGLLRDLADGDASGRSALEGKLASALQTDPIGAAPLMASFKTTLSRLDEAAS
ncbi:reverse transcriptase family protein [Roseateles sp. NT4]|uniref:reverse transcriptase family protein n=1 Tax=Roseateles sp. NT4 TaxID=3453715 RepID=UPI003EEEF2D3